MNITRLSIHSLRIPFVERFKHSLKDRAFSDTVVVRIETETGTVGYGEGLPRPYVTGETVESLMTHIEQSLWPIVHKTDFDSENIIESCLLHLPQHVSEGDIHAHNAARCAVELAIIDAALKENNQGLSHLLPPKLPHVTYSGIITGGSVESVYKRASQFKRIGMQHIKIKVGKTESFERVEAVRKALGEDAVLRVDANSAWSLDEASTILKSLEPLNVVACEEPLEARRWTELAALRTYTTIPLMADETLVSDADATQLIQHKAIDIFNIRLSKCGGIGPSLTLAQKAKAHGLSYQLGAHVGETAILSSAGRHVAAHLGEAQFVEGSYGTLLLTEDLSRTSLRFGHKGRGQLIGGSGLGLKILDDRIHTYTHTARDCSA